MSLFLFASKKMKGRETSYSEAEIV